VISDGFTGSFGITFGLRKVMFGDWVRSIEIAVFPVDSWEFLGVNGPARQSFYRAAGFVADGAVQVEFGVRAISMARR